MASKTINTILTLQDKMSPKLMKVSGKINDLDKKSQRATKQLCNMTNKFADSIGRTIGKIAKLGVATAGIVGVASIKTGLSEAMDLEGFRLQLETATKDAKKAGEIMQYAINLANKTPFEGGALVEGASKLESMGMSAQEWLPRIGDMAAATNKDFDQAVEALIDAQTGELERLKEFGITKAKITEKANEMFAGSVVVNNKGQIEDLEKFNQALVELMNTRFSGGMEKQATTVRGLWSTVTGVTKNALANIVGMQNDGTIKSGSLMELMKNKVKSLADQLQKWQTDGTIDRLSQKATLMFKTALSFLTKIYSFCVKYQDWIVFIGAFIVAATGVVKVITILKTVMTGINLVMMIFNGTLALCPLTWVVIAIAAVIAAGVLLIKNWDKVKESVQKLWEKIKEIWDKIKNLFKSPLKGFVNLIQNNTTKDERPKQRNGRNALGTSYWRGGRTSINERGGEIIDLPSGSRVIPADKSKAITNNNGGNTVNIYVNASGKSSDEIMNEIVPKLKLALENI